jgi:hypothetical protein
MPRENVLFGLGRSFATFLQGTWLNQIGFILYTPGVSSFMLALHSALGIKQFYVTS